MVVIVRFSIERVYSSYLLDITYLLHIISVVNSNLPGNDFLVLSMGGRPVMWPFSGEYLDWTG